MDTTTLVCLWVLVALAYLACGVLVGGIFGRTIGFGQDFIGDPFLLTLLWPTTALSLLGLGVVYVCCQPGVCWRWCWRMLAVWYRV